jgi:glycosyltransferase involved in cell wall biosynthesis
VGRSPIVLISGRDPSRAGGHESYVLAHALAAARIGFEPHIFFGSTATGTERTEIGVVHRVRVPPRRQPPVLAQIPLPTYMPLLGRGVANFLGPFAGGHLIHSFGVYGAAGVWAGRALKRRGVQAVSIASSYGTRAYELGALDDGLRAHHGLGNRVQYRAWRRWVTSVDDAVEGWGYTRSSLVLVNYESVRNILANAYGPRLRIRMIPYAAPDAFSEPAQAGAEPAPIADLGAPATPLVVSVSRHVPRKGVDLLLLALARVAASGAGFRACLVGPGKLLTSHRRLASALGLDRQLVIPGLVPDVAPYLSAADIFVLPSVAESSGSVSVLEAMRAGKPVIATACDGLPEDLIDGENGLLVAPGDVGALAEALRRLLADAELRSRLGAAARLTYERRFSADRFVAALADVYGELASPPGPRAGEGDGSWVR